MFIRIPTVLLAFGAVLLAQMPAPAATALTVQVHAHKNDESLDVSGTAPAGTSVDIVLYGALSADLPVVRVNHFHTQADTNGVFTLNVPIAANFTRGTVLTIQASTPDGTSATARTAVQGPGTEYIPNMDSLPDTPF